MLQSLSFTGLKTKKLFLECHFRPHAGPACIYYIDNSVLVENIPLIKVHTKLHPGLEWRIFHILTSEDIADAISRFYTVFCAKTLLSI